MTRHTLSHDIETASERDPADVGVHIYATHPSTFVRVVAFRVDDGPPQVWHPGEPPPEPFFCCASDDDWEAAAHNAAFEIAITRSILEREHGFPHIPTERYVCTMAQSLACALPGALEKIAKVLHLENQKDPASARLMRQMAKPRKLKKGEQVNGAQYYNDPERLAQLDQRCTGDAVLAREVSQSLPRLSPEEQLVWLLNQRINNCGFQLDHELALAMQTIAQAMKPRINAELTELTGGEVDAFTQVPSLKKWLKPHVDVATLRKDAIEELLEQNLPSDVRRVLELRLLGAQAAVAKVDAFLQRRCDDGRVRGSFIYHAASTGRFSSRGIQLHNLKRPLTEDLDRAIEIIRRGDLDYALAHYPNVLAVIGDLIRALIIAKLLHLLITGDFSGIEARVVAWLAGEESKLQVFRDFDAGIGPDPYLVAAGKIFNIDPKQLAADYAAGKPEAREKRQSGKASDLAFAFAGGVPAYRRFAPGTTLTDAEIEKIKHAWRRAHPRIVRLWSDLKQAAWQAVRNPGTVVPCGKLAFECDDAPYLWMWLPSGTRGLAFPHARIIKALKSDKKLVEHAHGPERLVSKDNARGRWHDVELGESVLVENATQAVARDLLTEAMLRIDAAGYQIVLHVHDSITIEVPEKGSEQALDEFTRLMQVVPEWAEKIPIAVKADMGKRFV